MPPETRYARFGDQHLAFQVLGTGPPDYLLVDQWFSHVEAQWDVPPVAAFRERLASFGRLIMFDKRGSGMSDPVPTSTLPTLEEWMADAVAVLDAVGSERAAVIANIGGGLLATVFAAAHPGRVASLVLVDCFARFAVDDDFPIGSPRSAIEQTVQSIEDAAGQGMMIDLFAPSYANDEHVRRAWARYERQAASPGMMKSVVRNIYESDVRSVLPAIRVPTLVLHHPTSPRFGPHGRYLAESIPGAKLVELPGDDALLWAGDHEAIIGEIVDFVTGVRPVREPKRVLATILFTDIVDSTRRAAELGDAGWRQVLDEHFRITRRQLDRFEGHEIKTVGDGILATFDGPARAVRCAVELRDATAELGVELRAGLHTGELEIQPGGDIAGLAVHVAARIAALAGAGEILVSSTVKELVLGSGLRFEDRGTRELKGLPDEWRVFVVG